ncbi:MAG: molybdopterin-dependent oxidoreductase [Siphonobacter sp.]
MNHYLFLFVFIGQVAAAQTVLKVSGEVTQPIQLQATDLKAMPHLEVKATDRDGKEHIYSGILLADILKKAGVTLGGQLRGENLVKYAIFRAADGYEVLFALPELDPEFSNQPIILADATDGAALPTGVGPYRVVVPNEKKPARWIREIREIEIRFAK